MIVLELHTEFNAYAPFLYTGQIAVCESVYIVHAQDFENVRYSGAYFHVRHCAKIVLLVVFVWKLEQLACVQWVGAVLFAQMTEHSTE